MYLIQYIYFEIRIAIYLVENFWAIKAFDVAVAVVVLFVLFIFISKRI